MKSILARSVPAGLLAVGAAVVFHFATPLALCGQESGSVAVQARVVDVRAAWTAHDLVAEVLATPEMDRIEVPVASRVPGANGDQASNATTSLSRVAPAGAPGPEAHGEVVSPALLLIERNGVVLQWERGGTRLRVMVADLSR